MRALLLPGGGARGVLQTGLIAAYLDTYKTYDALFGTSVGALNGSLLHQNEFHNLLDLWQTIRNNKVYTWNLLKMFGSAASLASDKPLMKLINQYVNIDKLKANPTKFFVSATNLQTMRAETKQMPCEDATKWILCSASAPLAFPTQIYNGKRYSDGGLMRDFNIQAAIDMGYEDIIVLCPSAVTQEPIKNIIDMLEFQLTVQSAIQYEDETQLAQILNRAKKTVSLTIYKPTPEQVPFGQLDFNYAGKNFEKLYQTGYNMLSKPSLQFRRTLQAGQPKWMIYR